MDWINSLTALHQLLWFRGWSWRRILLISTHTGRGLALCIISGILTWTSFEDTHRGKKTDTTDRVIKPKSSKDCHKHHNLKGGKRRGVDVSCCWSSNSQHFVGNLSKSLKSIILASVNNDHYLFFTLLLEENDV